VYLLIRIIRTINIILYKLLLCCLCIKNKDINDSEKDFEKDNEKDNENYIENDKKEKLIAT
jgi:hypothetical protein